MATKSFEKAAFGYEFRYTCKDLYAVRYNGVIGRFWERRILEKGAWVLSGTMFFRNKSTRKEITDWEPRYVHV